MSRHRKRAVLATFLLIFPCAGSAEDRTGGTDPLEAQFNNHESYPRHITENQLGDMSLSDPKLRIAYYWLIKAGVYDLMDNRYPPVTEVLKDVKRRGDSATPLWLDIMASNQDSALEYRIPLIIGEVGSINMAPYVDYLRKMIQTRWETISGGACRVALDTLFQYGNMEDVHLALDLAKKRPFLADYVQYAFDTEERRKAGLRTKPSSSKTSPAPAQTGDPRAPELAPATNHAASSHPEEPISTTLWLVTAAGLIFVALGVFWFLRKGQT